MIFPLSNPTHKAECTFEDAVRFTRKRRRSVTGSPFEPMTHDGSTGAVPGAGEQRGVFPALGHAAVLAGAREISDDVFLAGRRRSPSTAEKELRRRKLFPDFDAIQETSAALTAMVCEKLEPKCAGPETAGGHGLARARGERVLPAAGGSRDAREAVTTRRRMVRDE